MITLALDTATDRCSVAASNGKLLAERHLDGARRHAASVLDLMDQVLTEVGASHRHVDRIITANGPGSFTGLRVSASVAKALTWRKSTSWYTAPSLLVRATEHARPEGSRVVALSDALRGDVYAGCWQINSTGIIPVEGPPRAMRPADLRLFGAVNVLVGSVPDALVSDIETVAGATLIGGASALPQARHLLALLDVPGGTELIADPAKWEPEYGRPAEAQAVWERKHGKSLPDTPVIAR